MAWTAVHGHDVNHVSSQDGHYMCSGQGIHCPGMLHVDTALLTSKSASRASIALCLQATVKRESDLLVRVR